MVYFDTCYNEFALCGTSFFFCTWRKTVNCAAMYTVVRSYPHSKTPSLENTDMTVKAGRAWYLFSCEDDVIGKGPEFLEQKTMFSTLFNQNLCSNVPGSPTHSSPSLVPSPCVFVVCSTKFVQKAWSILSHVMHAAAYVMTILLETMMSDKLAPCLGLKDTRRIKL